MAEVGDVPVNPFDLGNLPSIIIPAAFLLSGLILPLCARRLGRALVAVLTWQPHSRRAPRVPAATTDHLA
jgi:hypothetical protein